MLTTFYQQANSKTNQKEYNSKATFTNITVAVSPESQKDSTSTPLSATRATMVVPAQRRNWVDQVSPADELAGCDAMRDLLHGCCREDEPSVTIPDFGDARLLQTGARFTHLCSRPPVHLTVESLQFLLNSDDWITACEKVVQSGICVGENWVGPLSLRSLLFVCLRSPELY
jgi:hypothetical protein